MKHTKRCWDIISHVSIINAVAVDGSPTIESLRWNSCATCGTWLPLGPSNDTPVAVEVRATELAANGGRGMREPELFGWQSADLGIFPYPREEAGYLAHVIAHHPESNDGP